MTNCKPFRHDKWNEKVERVDWNGEWKRADDMGKVAGVEWKVWMPTVKVENWEGA